MKLIMWRTVENCSGSEYWRQTFFNFNCANDIFLIANSHEELLELIRSLEKVSREYGIKMLNKTKEGRKLKHLKCGAVY